MKIQHSWINALAIMSVSIACGDVDSTSSGETLDELGQTTDSLTGLRCQSDGDCAAGTYCYPRGPIAGPQPPWYRTCQRKPILSQIGSESRFCADLGTAHPTPDFLAKYTIYGAQGEKAIKYNRHISCAGAQVEVAPESPLKLSRSGFFNISFPLNHPVSDCNHPVLGRWESYVTIDGLESNKRTLTYFNSRCPGVDTCASAGNYCPQ